MNGTLQTPTTPDPGPASGASPASTGPRAAAPGPPPAPDWSSERREAFDPRRKSPLLAFFLSAMPGLGQIYIGYYVRGFVHVAVVAIAISIIASGALGMRLEPVLGLFIPFFILYNMIDAGRRAALYNRAIRGGREIEMPEDFNLPSVGGSIAGGVILVTISVIALSNTLFGYSLDWIEDWWPVAPLLLGAWLLGRGVMDRMKTADAPDRRES